MGQARTPWSTRAADSKDTLIMLQSRPHFPTRRVGKPATLPLSFAGNALQGKQVSSQFKLMLWNVLYGCPPLALNSFMGRPLTLEPPLALNPPQKNNLAHHLPVRNGDDVQDYSFGVQGSRRACNSSFFLAEHFPQMRGGRVAGLPTRRVGSVGGPGA